MGPRGVLCRPWPSATPTADPAFILARVTPCAPHEVALGPRGGREASCLEPADLLGPVFLELHLGSRTVADPVLTHRGSGPNSPDPSRHSAIGGRSGCGAGAARLSKDAVEALAGGRAGSGAASVARADGRHSVLDGHVLASWREW